MEREATTNPTPRRRRWRRRVVIALIVVVLLVGLGFATIELVRRSDLPRRLAIDALQARTGLRVDIDAVEIGWLGESIARGVVVRLPLDNQVVFAAPTVRLTHASLLSVILTQDLGLAAVSLERPEIQMIEDASGNWTLLQAADLIRAAAPPSASATPVKMPRIDASAGIVNLRPRGRPSVSLPLDLSVVPDGALAVEVEAALGDATVRGRLTTTTWDQSLRISVSNAESIVALWVDDPPAPLEFDGAWEGRVRDSGIKGDLAISSVRAGEHRAAARVAVSVVDGAVIVDVADVSGRTPLLASSRVVVRDGVVRLAEGTITVSNLHAEAEGVAVHLAGEWDLVKSAGTAAARWSADAQGPELRHTGRAELSASLPKAGPVSASARIHSAGRGLGVGWRVDTIVSAEGPSWDEAQVEIAAPTLVGAMEGRTVDLSGLHTVLGVRWPRIEIASLTLPNAASTAALGVVDAASREWRVSVEADRLRSPLAIGEQIDVLLRAGGDARVIDVNELRVRTSMGELTASGTYDIERPEPLDAKVRISADVPSPLQAEGGAERINADLAIAGSVSPLMLHAEGSASMPRVGVAEGAIGPTTLPLRAVVFADAVTLRVEPTDLLGGCASVDATYLPEPSFLVVNMETSEAPLRELAGLFAPGLEIEGVLDAHAVARVPEWNTDQMTLDGSWRVRGAAGEGVSIDDGEGRFEAIDSGVRLSDMTLRRGEARATGAAELRGDALYVDISTESWPIEYEGTRAAVDARTRLDIDIPARSAVGTVALSANATLPRGVEARVALAGDIDRRTVHAREMRIEALGGALTGGFSLPIDNWTSARGTFDAERFNLAALAGALTPGTSITGIVNGRLTAHPAEGRNPLEPLQIRGDFTVADGSVEGIQLGDFGFVAYAGKERVIVDQSDLEFAGGTASAWSRLSFHAGQPFLHVNLNVSDFDVRQIAQAFRPNDPAFEQVTGDLDARASVGAYLTPPHRSFGEIQLDLHHAELQPLPAFAAVYSLMSINFDPKPTGEGSIRLRLEGDSLQISRLQYFNRGTDINGAGRIEDIRAGLRSPVKGALVGTVRPLKGSKLPFGPSLDRLLGGLLHDAVAVEIDGTIADPQTRAVPLADIYSFVQGMFGTRAVD